jgi:hypothetical protein
MDGGGGWSRTCDCLAAAEYPHVAVVPDEDELAADAHVEAGDHHDRPRDHAPQQQKEQRPGPQHFNVLTVFLRINIYYLFYFILRI